MKQDLLLKYCGYIFLLSWGLQIAAIVTVGDINASKAEPWLIAAMFTPCLITIVFIFLYKELRSKLLWKPNFRMLLYLLPAIFVPTLITFAVVSIVQFFGWGHSGWFTFSSDGVSISGGPWLLGRGLQSWLLFVINVFTTAIAFSLMNGIVAAFEEIGWRGFLQGILIERLGSTKAIILLGLLWSLWHLPAQLAGYNFPQTPILGSLIISPLELVAVSFFLGWLTIKSGSFIPAAIAHGAGNSIQEGVTANLQMTTPRIYEDLTTLTITILIGLVCWAMIHKFRYKNLAHITADITNHAN